MKAYLELINLRADVVTTSGEPQECCDYSCPGDGDQMAGNW